MALKKNILKFLLVFLFFGLFHSPVSAQDNLYGLPSIENPPIFCGKVESLSCPTEALEIYEQLRSQGAPDRCATSYEDFLTDPKTKHYWVEDPEITAQGKTDERARQFLYWVLTTNAIDSAPVLSEIWRFTSTIALVGVVLIAAVFGIGYIVSQRTNYDFKVRIWPTIIKIAVMLLYIVFSSAIILALIQFSEILMNLSFERLGGKELFNIYFDNGSTETLRGATEASYKNFVGCRDLNIRVKEAVDSEMFMLKLTNVSYYVMGIMLLLRKILLWFLLFVSPFLALLMPFVLIRNTGWIWIGVFFQWLFYGPLLTLFLGAMAKIWKVGIPFGFDFSRTKDIGGYVYPTGMNIVYGGPGQNSVAGRPISAMNNGSYTDTFTEYVITLIMLWAVTFFPWWLLRIFRDYCCDGIYAMKNILLAMYDNMRTPPSGPPPTKPPTQPSPKLKLDIPQATNIRVSLGSLDVIKKTLTTDISKNLSLKASKITDIAKVETNKTTKDTVTRNLNYLSAPVKASVPAERQQYMNLRSELFARAIKEDTVARAMLASTSTSISEKLEIRKNIIKSLPQSVSLPRVIFQETNVSEENIRKITNNYTQNITNNEKVLQSISKSTSTPVEKIRNVITTYNKYSNQAASKVISSVAKETEMSKTKVSEILKQVGVMTSQARILTNVSTSQKLDRSKVSEILTSVRSSFFGEKSILEKVSENTSFSIERTKEILNNVFHEASTNEQVIQRIATPQTPATQVRSIFNSYINNISQPAGKVVEKISKETSDSKETITTILKNASEVFKDSNFIQNVATLSSAKVNDVTAVIGNTVEATVQNTDNQETTTTNINAESVQKADNETFAPQIKKESVQVVNQLMTQAVTNENVVENLAKETKLQTQQVKNVMTTYAQNINKPQEEIIKTVNESSGVAKDEIESLIVFMAESLLSSEEIVSEVAKKEGIKEEDVANVMEEQMEVVNNPEENIDKTIQIPQNISIEDYEEVKEMWTKHYEEGEVPASENIKTRQDWVDQEIVYITNTLNKILSSDENLQQQGLDELGYLLPIFLINSLKGDELVVYLKAKLEAAKMVQKMLRREEKLKAKIKGEEEKEEVFVDIDKKEEKPKAKTMSFDEDDEEAKQAPKSIEDRVKAVQEKLNAVDEADKK